MKKILSLAVTLVLAIPMAQAEGRPHRFGFEQNREHQVQREDSRRDRRFGFHRYLNERDRMSRYRRDDNYDRERKEMRERRDENRRADYYNEPRRGRIGMGRHLGNGNQKYRFQQHYR